MQNPAREIEGVVKLLTTAASPDIQKSALQRHPLVDVPSAPNSRETILGIYQWYRIMSPHLALTVNNVAYIPEQNKIFLDITQDFHVRFDPFPLQPARLLVHLTLREENNLFYVSSQEDFYHTDDLIAVAFPILTKPVKLLLRLSAVGCNILARSAQLLFGVWLPRSKDD
ncbi:hypothetical protein EW146_g6536 [Bondarzewia mesenterica]|uniref:SigF-like NTF2-like domain-containing protein n=1 Tax=Bondarzewia mesenterica TaxID=1095465 RepID=A0A4V3XEH7_9AGAM|nr:hypothetical protein EW146_g6536 [Bondarzewia mesenterica]